MSNLTQFFGAVPSTASTATPITGTAVQALTAGDGVRLTNNGDFVKTARNGMKKDVFSHGHTLNASGVAGNLLDLTAESNYGRYTPQDNTNSGGFVCSDGTYIQIFYLTPNNTSSQFGWRSFTTDYAEGNTLTFKDWVSGGSTGTHMLGCEYREVYSDADFIHIAAAVQYHTSSTYRNTLYMLKMTKSTKVLSMVSSGTVNTAQYSPYNNGYINGSGTVGTLANGVLVNALQGGNATNDRTGRLGLSARVFNTAAPALPAAASLYLGAYADYNDAVSDCILHDHDTRTFISFEAPVDANNSKLVKKHVFDASGNITTTTVDSAFALSNFTNVIYNKYCRIFKVSTGVFAALYPETATTYSIQKFTWDGNTTLTQTGDKIVLTLPSGLTIQSAGTSTYNYYHLTRMVDNDPAQVYIQYGASTTSLNAAQNLVGIDLVAGTLRFAMTNYGLGNAGAHTAGGTIAMGATATVVRGNGNYQTFDYRRYDTAYFEHTLQTKEILGVALTDAARGATNASVAVFDGLQSTTALPAGTYISKNGQYYLMDVPNTTLGAASPLVFRKAAPFNGIHSNYNTEATISAQGYGHSYAGANSAVTNQAVAQYYNRNSKYSASCTANQTTTIIKIEGSGAVSNPIWWNGHTTTYNTGWQMWVDGVLFFEKLQANETGGNQGYYGRLELLNALPADYSGVLYFDNSFEFKCVTPTLTKVNFVSFNLHSRT